MERNRRNRLPWAIVLLIIILCCSIAYAGALGIDKIRSATSFASCKTVQMDNLVEVKENVAPPKLYHYNRFLSATISCGLAKGKTIGQG